VAFNDYFSFILCYCSVFLIVGRVALDVTHIVT